MIYILIIGSQEKHYILRIFNINNIISEELIGFVE